MIHRPARLTEAQRARICALAADVPALWEAPTTRPSERQAIVRQLIERVEVTVPDGCERVEVGLHWVGGYESRHEVRRPVSSYRRMQDGERVLTRVRELKQEGLPHAEVARCLNAEGLRGPRGQEFTVPMVSFLAARARGRGRPSEPTPAPPLWRGSVLARRLDVPAATLNTWRRRGWVHARCQSGRWVYWANDAELARLERLRGYSRVALSPLPPELTTPADSPPWRQDV